MRRAVARAIARALLCLLTCAGAARAQEFVPAAGSAVATAASAGALALLDSALPSVAQGSTIECGVTRWFALPQFETRVLALGAAVKSLRAAAGISQTGDPEYGWSAAALALGSAGEAGGMALRVAARHERSAGDLARATRDEGVGIEAGAGGWLALGGSARLWASAPQLVTRGEAPPLARALQLGAIVGGDDARAWCAIGAPSPGSDGRRELGGEVAAGPLALWTEARDGPWRASIGVRAARGALTVALRVDAHPELGETTRWSIALSPPRRSKSQP